MAIPDPNRKKNKGGKSKVQKAQEEVQQVDLSPEEEELLQEAMPD